MSNRLPESRACPTDSPIGILLMILSGAGIVATFLLASAIAALLGAFAPTETTSVSFDPTGPRPLEAPTQTHPWFITLLAVLLPLTFCVLVFWCGTGIRKGNPRAFSFGIILFSLAILGGTPSAVLAGGLVIYCLLRLLQVIGPPPEPAESQPEANA